MGGVRLQPHCAAGKSHTRAASALASTASRWFCCQASRRFFTLAAMRSPRRLRRKICKARMRGLCSNSTNGVTLLYTTMCTQQGASKAQRMHARVGAGRLDVPSHLTRTGRSIGWHWALCCARGAKALGARHVTASAQAGAHKRLCCLWSVPGGE